MEKATGKKQRAMSNNQVTTHFYQRIAQCLLCAFLLAFLSAQAHAEPVQSTSIEIEYVNVVLHEKVQERIKESVQTVAEKVVANREVQEIKTIASSLEKVLQKIFNQVLTGFYVSEVHIAPGAETKISVKIQPEKDVVESVKVKIELGSIHPDWQPLLDEKIQQISPKILPILTGIPVTASDWAPFIVRPVIEALIFVNAFFPGFTVDVEMSFGKETVVILKLKPQEPIIRNVSISIASRTMPNVYTKIVKYFISKKATMIVGLPVDFLKAHSAYLQNEVNRVFRNNRRKSTMVATVQIIVAEETKIRMTLDSTKYEGTLEGHVGFSTPDKNPELRGKFLAKFSQKDYLMLRALLFPSPITLELQAGAGRKLTDEVEAALVWDFKKDTFMGYAKYEDEKFHAEFIAAFKGSFNEASLGYKFKLPLRVEGVRRKNETSVDHWVRLIVRF